MPAIITWPNTPLTSIAISQSDKALKPNRIWPKRLNFSVELDSTKSCYRAGTRKTMAGLDKIRASTSGEGIQAFEQEALVEGSLNFGAGEIEATLNSLSKWFGVVAFVSISLWRHDAESLWASMGAVLNAMLSYVLKKILNQERPIATLRPDPGMPSSHAQSLFYITIFLNVTLLEWYGINGITATLCGLSFILASYFSWLRVSNKLHTISQITVGGFIGSVFSILWFWSWHSFVLRLFASYIGVRIFVVLVAVGFSLGFIRHVYLSWIMNEK